MAEKKKPEKKPAKKKKSKKEEKPPEEKIYYIPLRNAYRKTRRKRVRKAVNVVKEFLEEKAKVGEYSLDPRINEVLWSKGISKPPRGLKIKVVKTEEKTTVMPVE
jgi:large subunit ribosomal protein L31e